MIPEERPPAGVKAVARKVLGPRPAIIAFAGVCVVGVVLALAQLVLSTQNASRANERERFASGAVVRGQLTASLLSTSTTSLRAAARGLAPNTAALSRFATTSRLAYAALLSSDGKLLAVSKGAPASLSRRLAARPAYLRQALSGRSWLSDVMPAAQREKATVDWAIPFPSSAGRRVLIEGVPAGTLSPFLSSFLSQGSAGRNVYVIDSKRHLIAATKSAGPSKVLPAELANARSLSSQTIGGRFVASGPIGGSGWQIVRTQPTATLYPRDRRHAFLAAVGSRRARGNRRPREPDSTAALARARGRARRGACRGQRAQLVARGAGRRAHGARRAARARARPLECRARAVRIGRRSRPPGAAAQDPHVLRAADAPAGRRARGGRRGLRPPRFRGQPDAEPDQRPARPRARQQPRPRAGGHRPRRGRRGGPGGSRSAYRRGRRQ